MINPARKPPAKKTYEQMTKEEEELMTKDRMYADYVREERRHKDDN